MGLWALVMTSDKVVRSLRVEPDVPEQMRTDGRTLLLAAQPKRQAETPTGRWRGIQVEFEIFEHADLPKRGGPKPATLGV